MGCEPSRVLLRIFGTLGDGEAQHYKLVMETVIFTMLAERGLGPHLLGVFPGGRLEEFIPGHPLTTSQMRSPQFSTHVARNLALVHSLDIPISKEPSWLPDSLRLFVNMLRPITSEKVPLEEKEAALEISRWDLRSEIDWLLDFITVVNSPVVFAHNDVNTGNILVREDKHSPDSIVFIDYEFAAFNYRGFDIANHFNEWMYDYGKEEFPYYHRNPGNYPTTSQQESWVRVYVTTVKKQQGNNTGSSGGELCSNILREVAVFSLASHLLWALWSLKQAQHSNIPFAYYSFARDRLEDYTMHKAKIAHLINDNDKNCDVGNKGQKNASKL